MGTYMSRWRTLDVSANSQSVGGAQHLVTLDLQSLPAKRIGQWITLPGGYKYRRSTDYDRWRRVIEPGFPQYGIGKWFEAVRNKWHDLEVETTPGGFRFDFAVASQLYSAYSMPEVGLTINGLNMSPNIPTMSSNEAVVEALLELADGKANMGENLGTLGQTMRLLCDPVKALAGGLQSVYNNKSLRPFLRESLLSLKKKGISSRAAEEYLKYVYGWKPLMQDIYGLIDLAKGEAEKPLLLTGRGKAVREQAPKGGSYSEASHKTRTTVSGGTFKSTVRAQLTARLDPDYSGTRTLNQLGLANPLATAWELVSYSFVVDWFVPIGPVLNAMSAPAGLIFVDGSKSNRVTGTATYTNRYTGVDNKIGSSDATGKIIYEGYRREGIRSWPKVGVWVSPDPFRGDRLLKATALLVANVKTLD